MEKQLLDVKEIGAIIGAGVRTVYRWADSGRMPRPLKIGGAVRWRRADIEEWITAGCPKCR